MLGDPAATLWTIGHSTRSPDEFLGLLARHGITFLADVRRFPTSRRVPWADGAALAASLGEARIEYAHFEALGGYRRPSPTSGNTEWRSAAFRGYADHMATPEFHESLDRLIAVARRSRVAAMCAEAVPWRCHRNLLSDALVARGVRVLHILAPGRADPHRLTAFAKVRAGGVEYPAKSAKPLKRRRR